VFLFDEPLSNLDAALRGAMRIEISELHFSLKTTMIYVTHDQIEAMTMADRIVVMHDGIVEQIGTPLDLYDNPHNTFVAGFIGSPAMNFMRGRLRVNGRTTFESEGGFILPIDNAPAATDGRPLVCGIRPEHLSIDTAGIDAQVVVVEPTGSETQVVARYGDQEITCLFRERITARPGENIQISANPALVHLFDPDSGKHL
jgi:multiple sugar transport system ATP-binding protein